MIELNILHLENGYSKSYLFDSSSFIIRLVIVLFFLNTVVALTFFLRTCLSLVPILWIFFDNSQVVRIPIAISKKFSNLIPFMKTI